MGRKTAMVVCPGRGVYNAPELGYLKRHHPGKTALIERFDAQRRDNGQPSIAELDAAERYTVSTYTRGDNASGLIYACSYADFLDIDRHQIDIVAVTGNSMGWYTTLACAGALDADAGFRVVNTMGTFMHQALIGGQILHPFVDDDWRAIPGRRDLLLALARDIPGLHVSIHLGGMIVLAGDADALDAVERRLQPVDGRFPMRLGNHAAFHTPLQEPISRQGRAALGQDLFAQPDIPMIDGRGHVWLPKAVDTEALWDYSFGHQVVRPYDFTRAVITGVHEFAPDMLIILGPGTTLGGATAQALIACGWLGLSSKTAFKRLQDRSPVIRQMP